MPVNSETNAAQGQTTLLEGNAPEGVYASLFEKINLKPVSEMSALDIWQDAQAMSDATADERLTAGMQVFLECLTKSGSKVEKLDKNLIDHHIAELDYQISRQLDAVMHSEEFQAVESLWRGVKSLVDKTDFRQNVKVELLDMSKEDLRQDFEDSPEIIQSGLYKHTYIDEYDTPGGEPIAALISAYEFDASAQDVALLRNISKVSAAAHMPFIGSAGPKFFLKDSMEKVAAIKDIGNYFDRAEYIKWKSFRETDDARYIGLVMPRVLGRLPYGPDTVPVRSFNYVEEVKGPDHNKYLWTNASFAFAANMVRSFINNGWCVQIRGPQAGGAVQDLPIHLYDLGTGNQVKIPSEVMIPETREFEFANLGFIPLSYYKNRDYACFFSANSTQKPALYDTADATANSRINARLPYIFLLSRIAHYLKLIQRENIGTTKDRRLLELELNTWVRGLVTEMTDPGDELQASHPLRDAKVVVEDIEDNPGFFRVKLYAVPHFQVEGMDVSQLYRAEQLLTALAGVLQRLELKHLSQLDTLRTLMHNSAVRLENSDGITSTGSNIQPGIVLPATVMNDAAASTRDFAGGPDEDTPESAVKWVYVAQPEPQSNVEVLSTMPVPVKKWKSFAAGMCTMLVISIASVWSWHFLHRPDSLRTQLAASLAPFPAPLTSEQLGMLRQQTPLPQDLIAQTQQQLARLDRLPPDWNLAYSRKLTQQAQELWPEQAKPLAKKWQQRLNAAALPTEQLDGWHQGMMKLKQLSDRLNGLDEQKGKYMTVSELKSVVFSTMQSFNKSVPAEEQMRVLLQNPEREPLPAAARAQLEMHLKQLTARYAEIQENAESPGA